MVALLHGNTYSVELTPSDRTMVKNIANNIMDGIERMNNGQDYNSNPTFSNWMKTQWARATGYKTYHLDISKFGTGNWSMLSYGDYGRTLTGSNAPWKDDNAGNQDVIWTELPVYGSITVKGCDSEDPAGGCATTGKAKLNGATFTITNKSGNPIYYNGVVYANNAVVATQSITGGACTLPKVSNLPFGTYEVKQTILGEGYNPSTNSSQTVTISANNSTVDFTVQFCNRVMRGNVKFTKKDDTNAIMSDIVFEIKSSTTNEKHRVVTNGNGVVDTSLIAHNSHTNGYDAMDLNNITFQNNYGTWFYGVESGRTAVDNSVSALPYDDYTITELSTSGNQYCDAESFSKTFSITAENTISIDLGTFTNDCTNFNITTTAVDGNTTDSHYILPKASATIKDIVSYTVKEGFTYRLDGEVIDKTNNNTRIAIQTDSFNATSQTGTRTLVFTFDASSLAGHELVVYERLYRDNVLIASHVEPNDANQIVRVSNLDLSTVAKDNSDGNKYVEAGKAATIKDEVTFHGKPNTEYRIKGVIKIKGTSQILSTKYASPSTDASGTGTTTMNLTLTAANLANKEGKELIVYEYMCEASDTNCDNKIFSHDSDDDYNQTIFIASLSTVATDADGDKVIAEQDNAEVRDIVRYCGRKSLNYTLRSELVEKSNPTNIITSKETPVTTDANGCGDARIVLDFNAIGLFGKELVVYEYLMDGVVTAAIHADPNDANQTVKVMNLNTIAYDATIVDKYVEAKDTAEVKDQVDYCVEANHAYRLVSKLMDKETRAVATDRNGQQIIEETTINTPNGCDQELVTFTFDPFGLYGKELVAFEYIYDGDDLVLAHEDFDDPNQFVNIVSLDTTAKDKKDDDKLVRNDNDAAIIDVVDYCLRAGQQYKLKGVLKDKATGNSVLINGNEITSEKTITPGSNCGQVEIEFRFDASVLAGTDVVVFESVYIEKENEEDELVVSHEDINDTAQLVTIISLDTTAGDPDDDDQLITSNTESIIVDRVDYCLKAGEKYTLKGVLMDKSTKKPVLIDGKEVTSSMPLEPTKNCGFVEMEFKFDASSLNGTNLVVYEYVYREGEEDEKPVISHTDIYDQDQFADIISLDTTAKDKKDGNKSIEAEKDATIIDVVDYCLEADREYILKGILMDKSTKQALLVNGKEVTNAIPLKTTEKCGQIEMEFTFDASNLGGTDIVVFESVYIPADKEDCKEDGEEGEDGEDGEDDAEICKEDQLIIAHEDIDDDAQLVTVLEPDIPDTGFITRNSDGGEVINPTIIIAVVATSVVALGATGARLIARRKMLR